ncbi:hypothetical protein ACOSP7_005188 [Xanthoceras sorbifolium]
MRNVLSFSVRRGANPAGVRSLGGQGVGVGVHGIAACNGGLCVGERRVLVSAVGSVVPIPDSERATGAVLLGPGVSSGGLKLRIGERKAVGPVVGNGLGGTSLRRRVLGAARCTGGDVAAAATTHFPTHKSKSHFRITSRNIFKVFNSKIPLSRRPPLHLEKVKTK